MTRRYFVHDSDKRAYSYIAPTDDTVNMYLRAGFREVATRAEYLAFRREWKPAGQHHVWFTWQSNTAIARAAKRAGLKEDAYIAACVHIHLKNSGYLREQTSAPTATKPRTVSAPDNAGGFDDLTPEQQDVYLRGK